MSHTAFRPAVLSLLFVATLGFALSGEAAQPPSPATSGRQPGVPQGQAAPFVSDRADAQQTRRAFSDVLGTYPPSLGRVLKLDPTLLTSQDYLAPYPDLAVFLAQHPQVAHNPGYFLEQVDGGNMGNDPDWQARQGFENMVGNFTAFLVFLVVTGLLVWLIRLFVDHRRWNRLSKIQTDVHTKLLDRFSSNDDLLAYIQTTAGRKFLESAPIPLHDEGRPLGAPFARILWSVQAGIVLAIGGLGVLFVSTRFDNEPAQFFFVVGMVTLALGGGFVVSAIAAYVLSQRLGLLEKSATDHA